MKKVFSADRAPIKVFGLPNFYKTGEWRRLPDSLTEKVPSIRQFSHRLAGARVAFRTDAEEFTLRCTVKVGVTNQATSLLFATGFTVYAGERGSSRYLGYLSVIEDNGDWMTLEKSFCKGAGMEDVTVFLASQVLVRTCEIIVDEAAKLEEPTPYKYPLPVVFYGSSITAGGAASRAGNSYVALLSRWLDFDYINLGFPGSARGEAPVAEFISELEMSVFVYDYDHNARTPEELKETHKPFFDIVRAAHPDIPIIMMTRPCGDEDPEDTEKRRQIVLKTYHGALDAGDKNVYFVDGNGMLGEKDRHACTIDLIHPTDLGFMRMAEYIRPTFEKALATLK